MALQSSIRKSSNSPLSTKKRKPSATVQKIRSVLRELATHFPEVESRLHCNVLQNPDVLTPPSFEEEDRRIITGTGGDEPPPVHLNLLDLLSRIQVIPESRPVLFEMREKLPRFDQQLMSRKLENVIRQQWAHHPLLFLRIRREVDHTGRVIFRYNLECPPSS